VYFSFVTGLTIGYGDLAPSMAPTKLLAVLTGLLGIVLTVSAGTGPSLLRVMCAERYAVAEVLRWQEMWRGLWQALVPALVLAPVRRSGSRS
jgi:Ion channel